MASSRSIEKTLLQAGFFALLVTTGCGDKPAPPAPSASTEVKLPACETLSAADQSKRCDTGDAHCCTLRLDATKTSDPNYFDVVAKACTTGHEPACQIVRDSFRDASWKLDTLEKACSRTGHWTCRTATELAVIVSPERVPKVFENFCRQTGDSELVLGGVVLKCGALDTTKLNDMRVSVDACKKGDLAACKQVAGVDGAAYDLFAQIAWSGRGVEPSTAADNRIERDYLGSIIDRTGPLHGTVTVSVDDPGPFDKKALAAAIVKERKDDLDRCVAWAMDHDASTTGELKLETTIDKSGRIAYLKEATSTLKTKTDLSDCVRHRLQDAVVADARADVKTATISLKFAH